MANHIEGFCYVCESPLIWNKDDPNCFLDDTLVDEEGVMKEITCEHCGTVYRNWVYPYNDPETFPDRMPSCRYQGFGNCIHCGGTLIWDNDFMRSDFEQNDDGSDLKDDDDALVRSLTCSQCGCSIEVFEPSPNEMKNYPFWKNIKH